MIISPGVLVEGMTVKNLLQKSARRNELIADIFSRMDKAERIGTGMKRIKDALKEEGQKFPKVENDMFFSMIFERLLEFRSVGEKTVEKTVEKILQLIAENNHITQEILIKETGLTRRGVEWNLEKLKSAGLLERIGPDKGGHWKVNKK